MNEVVTGESQSYLDFGSLETVSKLMYGTGFQPFSLCLSILGASPQAGMASRLWRLNCCETKALKGRRPGLYQPGAAPQD